MNDTACIRRPSVARSYFLLAAAIAAAAAVPTLPATLRADPPEGRWTLVFQDEFNAGGDELDKHWHFQNGPSGHILCSRWRENVAAKDGLCRILNRKEDRGGQQWTSGSMWSKRQFKYGYFEARYRFAATTGLNNSFWIMTVAPSKPASGSTADSGRFPHPNEMPEQSGRFEIDICEGHWPDKIHMNIHNWSGKHWSKPKTYRAEGKDLGRDFHVYGLLWNVDELVWFFEGREIRREPNTICHGEAPVWFSSAVMKWAGEVTDKIDGTAMEVDYVRVYQRETPEK